MNTHNILLMKKDDIPSLRQNNNYVKINYNNV